MKRILLLLAVCFIAVVTDAQVYEIPEITEITEVVVTEVEPTYTDYSQYDELANAYERYTNYLLIASVLCFVVTIAMIIAFFMLCNNVKELLYHIRRRDGVRWDRNKFVAYHEDDLR